MTTWLTAPLVVKEARALAPIWLGTVLTIVAGAQAGMVAGSVFAFMLGAAALGVFSIGHEYAHRTLTSLLAQPLSRSRLLMSKVVVLAPLLVLLSLVAALVPLRTDGIERLLGDGTLGARWGLAIVVLTPLLGLSVAPWLTMVFRSPMAGLVFTLAVPAALWIAGQIARAVSVDFDFVALEIGSPFEYGPALVLITIGVLAVSIVAIVHGRTLFYGLEALDAPRDFVPAAAGRLPLVGTADAPSHRRRVARRGPLLLLVRKEVRLYGLVFALPALYAAGWSAMWLAGTSAYFAGDSFDALAGMYGLFIAVLVGAISVAEERALGTDNMRILQPWPSWKLSLVKLATVGLMTLLLGLAVPTALEAAMPMIGNAGAVGPTWTFFTFYLPKPLNGSAATILLTALVSSYVSTLCVGGLRALLVALPVSFSLSALYLNMLFVSERLYRTIVEGLYGRSDRPWWFGLPTATNGDYRTVFLYSRWIAAAAFIGFVALMLFLCVRTSRSGERGMTLAKAQLPWVAVYVACAAVLIRGGGAVLEWWAFTH